VVHTPAHTLRWNDPAGVPPEPLGVVPARRGVAVLSAADGRVVTLIVTADARRLARTRLGSTRDERGESDAACDAASVPAADLRPVTRRLDLYTAGSALEADLIFLEIARAALPHVYRAATDRWRAWCVQLDPDATTPTRRKVRLGELPRSEREPRTLVGPFRDKDAAGRYGEALDDLFELCRYPRELALAPNGTPCVYKEMGRCPAACDGSEPMDAYRARARAALALSPHDRRTGAEQAERAMRAAAETHDFERAARMKDRAARFASLTKPAFAWADRLDRARWLAALPSERRGRVRLLALAAGSWRPIADVDPGRPDLPDAVAEADRWLAAQPVSAPDDPACDALGLVASYLYGRPKLRAGGVSRRAGLEPGTINHDLQAAIRSASRVKDDPAPDDPEREHPAPEDRDRELSGD